MANYSPNDIFTMVKPFVKGVPLADVQYIAFDAVHSLIWLTYPWTWTLKQLTAIALVDATQDYTISNSDFVRLTNGRITRTDLSPNRYQELTLVEYLAPELNIKTSWGNFRLITRDPRSGKLRLESAAQVPTGITMQIDGDFQYTPVKITSTNFSTALLSPDYYAQVYVNGLLYWFYRFTDDSRAGSVGMARSGEAQYTGALGAFLYSLSAMASKEDEINGMGYEFPSDAIGASLTGRILSIYGP